MSCPRFQLRSDVRYRIVDHQAVVLCQEQAEVLGLNEVGSRVLDLIHADRMPLADLISTLAKDYEVDLQQLEQDISQFLTELVERGVVEEVDTAGIDEPADER